MIEVKLTVSQVADQIGENIHTVRNWIRDFKPYLGLEKSPGGYNLFNQESLSKIEMIQKYYRDQKLSTKQITAILSGAEKPALQEESEYKQILEHLKRQEEFNKVVAAALQEQRRLFEDHVKKRDEQLVLALTEMRAARIEQKKKKNIFLRLFKGE